MTRTNEWSMKAIKTCKEILAASAFIVFEISDNFIDAQYAFGTLRVQLFNGDIKDVSESLKDLHYIMEIDNFEFGKYTRCLIHMKLEFMWKITFASHRIR